MSMFVRATAAAFSAIERFMLWRRGYRWDAVTIADGTLAHFLFRPGTTPSATPPIVLIHGATMEVGYFTLDVFSRVALRTDQAVYSLVLPWHGKMKDVQPGSFDEGADYVLAVLDALQLHQFILVGYSLGGATGIEIAARVPERLVRLVAIAPPVAAGYELLYPDMFVDLSSIDTSPEVARRTFAWETVDEMEDCWVRMGIPKGSVPQFFLRMVAYRRATTYAPGHWLKFIKNFNAATQISPLTTEQWTGLRRFAADGRLLVIVGDHDRVSCPKKTEALVKAELPGTVFEVIAGAEHVWVAKEKATIAALGGARAADWCGIAAPPAAPWNRRRLMMRLLTGLVALTYSAFLAGDAVSAT